MACRNDRERDLVRSLRRFIGETVTIYTTSGGDSGRGFTGVLIAVTGDPIVRLIAEFGPAPGCALGSCCDKKHGRNGSCRNSLEDDDDDDNEMEQARFQCGRIRNTGAVVDIPINRIVAFVHNTL